MLEGGRLGGLEGGLVQGKVIGRGRAWDLEGGLDQGKRGCEGLAMVVVTVTEALPARPTGTTLATTCLGRMVLAPVQPTGTTLTTACLGRMVLAPAQPTGKTSMWSRLDLWWWGW